MAQKERPASTPETDVRQVLGLNEPAGARLLRRTWWLWLLAVIVAAGAWYLFSGNGASNGIQYRMDTLSRGDITVIVTAIGTIQPTNEVDVSSELSGIIKTVLVKHNARVRAGQTLAELDTDRLSAATERPAMPHAMVRRMLRSSASMTSQI